MSARKIHIHKHSFKALALLCTACWLLCDRRQFCLLFRRSTTSIYEAWRLSWTGQSRSSNTFIWMSTNLIRHDCDSEDVRQGDDNAAHWHWQQVLTGDSSSLVHTHAISDPIYIDPVRKLPVEILAKIFIECIPSLVHGSPGPSPSDRPQQVRARLGRVCRWWNAILNDVPAVWATLVLGVRLPALETVSLWIKRSKSHPLDVSLQTNDWSGHTDMEVAGDPVVKMLHTELWRIRSFFAEDFYDYNEISPLFPPDSLTEAPMMQSLMLQCGRHHPKGHLGHIHCPQLHTLTLQNCDKAVESLIFKPMQNLRVLTIINDLDDNMLYIKLLRALPNLVSLTWSNSVRLRHHHGDGPSGSGLRLHAEQEVILRSLKSLTLRRGPWVQAVVVHFLKCLHVPSLEHLELGYHHLFNIHSGSLNRVLDVICGDGVVELRRLTLGKGALRGANFEAMWHHLKHLETLSISDADSDVSANKLFIALSPRNRDFSSVCPQLKTVELCVEISTGALIDFVQRRVKADLDDPGLGLVTCFKLSNIWVDTEVSAQFAKSHSLSVHLGSNFSPCTSPLAHSLAD